MDQIEMEEKHHMKLVDRVLDKIDPKRNKLRINYPTDSHPNSLGHKVICDYLYKEVEKKWQFTSY